MTYIKMVFATLLLVIWCITMTFVYGLHRVFRLRPKASLYQLFHRVTCRIFGLHVQINGTLSTEKPVLFVSNHISYLDIFIIGASVPGFFIAKSEVASWPFLGMMAKFQNTLFFERKGRQVKGQIETMTAHFDKKGSLILFPEGTSTDGQDVKTFKSSLLTSLEYSRYPVAIQPITIAYTHYKNKKMTQTDRDQFAWYADMPFASHFFNALGIGKANVSLTLHPTCYLSDFDSRKSCAEHCTQVVRRTLLNENT